MYGIRIGSIALAIALAAFNPAPADEADSPEDMPAVDMTDVDMSAVDMSDMDMSEADMSLEEVGEHDWLIEHATIQRLLKLHNETRARYGRAPLTLNTEMCLQAQAHAKRMADHGWYAHSGLPYYENIAYSQRTAEAVVRTWTYSPAHNANLQRGTQAGFGYAVRNGRPYWVAVFR